MKFFVVGVDVEDVRLRIVNGRYRMVLVDPTIALLTGVEIVADVTYVYLSVDLLNKCLRVSQGRHTKRRYRGY